MHIVHMETLKTDRIHVVVSPSEKDLFEKAAKEVGLSLSSWLRTVGIAAARRVVIGTKDGTRQ